MYSVCMLSWDTNLVDYRLEDIWSNLSSSKKEIYQVNEDILDFDTVMEQIVDAGHSQLLSQVQCNT